MKYSYNLDKKDVVFAGANDINASFKDLTAVCDSIRYKKATDAIALLDSIINEGKPIPYRKFNKGMGSRHELGGRKGRYPKKAASIVKKVVLNAYANAANKGFMPEDMYVVHAAANKTEINRRYPPKGVRTVMRGGYGYATMRRSDLEFAKVEIALSNDYSAKSKRLARVFNAVRLQEQKHAKEASKANLKGKRVPSTKPAKKTQVLKLPQGEHSSNEPAKSTAEVSKTEAKPEKKQEENKNEKNQ
ncbi:MAG: 50S ribosomal protein L22 [Candidatus Micrarchaeia archaeon]